MNASAADCYNLARILQAFCLVSGQSINLDKSSLFFSTNTAEYIKEEVGRILGIQASTDPGKYLGIPSISGKTKHQALAYVRERVASKLQGWGQSLLSFAGREVMIKEVIQAIPIYPMHCFRFPVKSCKEIHSLIANFWWDGNAFGNRTHWKAWDVLTEGKSHGGMGFRDLVVMNEAMLAKTAWRLYSNPDALWARVLKGLYFPDVGFLKAEKGHRASWCWSSILDGHDFIKKDLRWDVGSGSSIQIWDDKWVPGVSFPEKPLDSTNPYVNHGFVSDLIVNGTWDLSPIDHMLPREVHNAILEIPIPSNGLEDKLIWDKAANGVYSV